MIRSIAGSIARPLAVAITGASGGAVPDLAADVRALFSANGGDFTGTMLDFGKTENLYSDFEGTEAGDGDTLALVVDDQQSGALSDAEYDFESGASTINSATITNRVNGVTVQQGANTRGGVQFNFGATSGVVYRLRFSASLGGLASRRFITNSDLGTVGFSSWDGSEETYYVRWDGGGTGIRLVIEHNDNGASAEFTVDSVVFEEVLGNHADQTSAASRPTLTTDAFGARVAQPDGTDDYMDLPDGVLGDGTDHVHVFAAYALNQANSDTYPFVLRGAGANYGIGVLHDATTRKTRMALLEAGTARGVITNYDRPLTNNETVVRMDSFATATDYFSRINGAEVQRASVTYAALDDPGAGTIFGDTTANNLAGTCHGIVVLTGSRAMTAAEITTVEAYLADLASDTLLTADPDTVLSRVFRPASDLDYQSDFSTLDGWAEAGASVTVSGGKLVIAGSGGNARAQRRFPVRVGYAYTFSMENDGPDILQYDIDTSGFTGGGDIVNTTVASGASGVRTIVATSPFLYVQLTTSSGNSASVPDFSVTEIPATGDYWDLLDPTKRFTDAGSTQAGANDNVQQINSVEGDYPLTQTTSADQATLDGTATNLVFDGSTDFYVATDATDDLVQTGDTTELWAVTPDVSASARVISSAGDSTVATDTASVFSINGSDQLSLQQADASNTETEATAITVTEGAVNVISFVRDGASVVFGIGADEVETETFATVTTPTAGTSPAFNLGISVDQSSGPYDGSIQAGLKVDRALSTGLTIHAIRALEEKTA